MGAGPGTTEHTSSSSETPSKRKSSSSTSGKSRASPLMPGSSLFLEYTKRTAMEAQAQRTNVRLLELERKTNDETMAENLQGVRPDDVPLPVYPNTASRKNITVRRSRDRLSAASSVSRRVQKNSPFVYLSIGRGMYVILSRATLLLEGQSRVILLLQGQLLLRTEGNMAGKFKSLTFAIEDLLLK
jgi:hypothetical protein